MGSLAYIGNAAVFDFNGMNFGGGLLAVYLWRSVYFAQSVSFRTRCLLAMDWSKRALFGRGEYRLLLISRLCWVASEDVCRWRFRWTPRADLLVLQIL